MVNTFLPFQDFKRSAQALDNKRLGKQRVEALQILRANLGETKGWRNHPAAKMWRGHEYYLYYYIIAMCDEWEARGFKDTCRDQASELVIAHKPYVLNTNKRPWWLGLRDFHRAMRSNLKRKDPEHYDFPGPDDLPYLWPRDNKELTPTPTIKGKTDGPKARIRNPRKRKESGIL